MILRCISERFPSILFQFYTVMPSYLPFTVLTLPQYHIFVLFSFSFQTGHQQTNWKTESTVVIFSPVPCLIFSTSCQNNSRMSRAISVGTHKVFPLGWHTHSHGTMRAWRDEAYSECARKFHCHTQDVSSTHTVDASNFSVMFCFAHQGQFYKDAFPYQLLLQGKKAFWR